MTEATARAQLARDLKAGREAAAYRAAQGLAPTVYVLTTPDVAEALTRPLGVLESDEEREQAASDSVPSGAAVSQGDGYRDGGDDARPLLPLPRRCNARAGWGWHRCKLGPGHDGDCLCSCGIPFNGEGAF